MGPSNIHTHSGRMLKDCKIKCRESLNFGSLAPRSFGSCKQSSFLSFGSEQLKKLLSGIVVACNETGSLAA